MLKKLGDYLTNLMDFEPQKIVIGRENFIKLDTQDDFIIIDYLSSTPIGGFSSFDGDIEKINIGTLTRFRATILTIGNNASDNINKIGLLIKSQKSLELQKALGIRIGFALSAKNLKELFGSIYNDMFEIELNVDTTNSIDIDTLRIDTVQMQINDENGVVYDGSI